MAAVGAGHLEIAKFLVSEMDAEINKVDIHNNNLVIRACRMG